MKMAASRRFAPLNEVKTKMVGESEVVGGLETGKGQAKKNQPKLTVLNGVAKDRRVPPPVNTSTATATTTTTTNNNSKNISNNSKASVQAKVANVKGRQHDGEDLRAMSTSMKALMTKECQDPFSFTEYAPDIINYWLSLEKKWQLPLDYLERSSSIDQGTRAILVNWLIQVAEHMSLFPETLELCVNMLDRYVASKQVNVSLYQLLGITCLLVACKYEERQTPEVKELLYLTENSYKPRQVMKQEVALLTKLAFQVFTPIPSLYVPPLLRIARETAGRAATVSFESVEHLTRYILALSMTRSQFSSAPASIRASAAISLSLELIKRSERGAPPSGDGEDIQLITLNERSVTLVRKCVSFMAHMILKHHSDTSLQSARDQFSSETYGCISELAVLKNSDVLRELSSDA